MIFNRIKDVVCHPSRIGLYLKDKAYVVILHLVIFMALFFGILAFDNLYKPDAFNRNVSMRICHEIIETEDPSEGTIEYKDYKFVGSTEFELDDFMIYVNREVVDKGFTTFVLIFNESEVSCYFRGKKVFNDTYEELNLNYNFEIGKIQENSVNDRIQFVEFITPLIEKYEDTYSIYKLEYNLRTIILYYICLMVAIFILTVIANPEIVFKYRWKLMIYDSLIFFVVSSLFLLLGISWGLYAAVGFSVIYANITFSHIIKVKVKKV